MTDFRSVQTKVVVIIDGKEYTLEEYDYSETVTTAIEDGAIGDTAQDIIDYVMGV